MSAKTSKLVRIALAAAIAASGAIASTVLTSTAAHATSSTNGQISRSEILARAQYWYDQRANISYNQGGSYPDQQGASYRTDCSGYVDMAWHLGSGPNTDGLVGYSNAISFDDLKPGDILDSSPHVILFEKWDDSSHQTFDYYSFGSTPVKHVTGATRTGDTAGSGLFRSTAVSAYTPRRYTNVVDDAPVSVRPSAVGVFRGGTWALRGASGATTSAVFGQAGDVPITGDWDGYGHDQLGVFRPSTNTFALRHDDGSSTSLVFGNSGDIPVPGMWDHNGHAQMAIYRPSTNTFSVRHDDGTVTSLAFGNPGDIPVVGDWDGVGHTQVGVFRPGANPGDANTFALRHDDGSVSTATYGVQGDVPVVGDWAGKGRTTFGIFRPGNATYALSNAYAGTSDSTFQYGNPGDTPVTGNWN